MSERRELRTWIPALAGLGLAGIGVLAVVVAVVRDAPSLVVGVLVAATSAAAAGGLLATAAARRPEEEQRQPREPHGYHGYPCACADPGRRRLLGRGAVGAVAAVAVASGFPLWSLTRRAERRLRETAWARGRRLIDDRGQPVRADDLLLGAFTTVWPEGHTDEGDAQAVLIRLREGQTIGEPGRTDWTVDGHVAYSKLCTHMGCPVGLYQAEDDVLVCPCHQATFDVLRGATPVHGPAHRALPQLPLAVDDEGFLVADGDFPDAVGPGFWSRPS